MNVAANPNNKLPHKYKPKLPYRCCSSILIHSHEKLEKVVNPPQMPVAKNKRHSPKPACLAANPITMPMIKQPMMFTVNVANGNLSCLIITENKYLSIEPMVPPMPTNIKFRIIISYHQM